MQAIAAQFKSGEFWWLALGFLAQGVFFARMLVQWLASERLRRSVVPATFWYLSLAGGVMLFAYALHKRDPVFLLGQAIGIFIYARNIILIRGTSARWFAAGALVAGPAVAALFVTLARGERLVLPGEPGGSALWLGFGFAAQALFQLRFLLQWLASERCGKSVMPKAFWHISLAGGLLLAIYAIHRRDPVFVFGQGVGVFVYVRNIIFIHGGRGRDIAAAVALMALSAALFFVGNDGPALWGSSEARAAGIAREMHETGEYIVPHINGAPALTKPPLYHWMAAGCFHAFGVNEFAARLPSAVAGLLAVLTTFILARKMLGRAAGFMAAVMTAASADFVLNARAARTDMVFAFFTIAAVTAFLYAAQSERRKRFFYILSSALMGLAVMTKGPAGFFLPALAGLAYLWTGGRRSQLRAIPWLACAAAFLAVVLPWHLAVSMRVTAAQLRFYFFGQMAQWATAETGASGVLESSLLYIPYLLKAFFPWSFFLPAGLYVSCRSIRGGRHGNLVLPMVWFVAGLTAFSFSSTKASRYMVPMFPAAAILVAHFWREAWAALGAREDDGARRALCWLRRSSIPLAAVSAGLAAVVIAGPPAFAAAERLGMLDRLNTLDSFMAGVWQQFLSQHKLGFGAAAAAFALMSLLGLAAVFRGRLTHAFALFAAATTGSIMLFEMAVIPRIDEIYGVRQFAAEARALSDGGPFGWSGGASLETLFYLGRVIDGVDASRVRKYLEDDPRALVLIWEKNLWHLPEDAREYARVVLRSRVKHRPAMLLGSPLRNHAEDMPGLRDVIDEHPAVSETADNESLESFELGQQAAQFL